MKLPLGEKLNSAKGGFAYSAYVAFWIVISLIASAIISSSGLSGTEAEKYISYLVSTVSILIALVAFFLLAEQKPKEVIKFKCKPKYYLIAVMLIFGLLFSLSYLNEYFVRLLVLLGYKRRTDDYLPNYSGVNLIPVLFVIALLPAIFEETLFRGVILNNTESSCGTVAAVLLNGLCFMLYHGSVEQTIYQFICGCLFALLAVRAGSLLPTVLMHFLNNGIILVLSACGVLRNDGYLDVPLAANIVIITLAALCLCGAIVMLILDKKPIKKEQEGGLKKFFISASVGLFVMTLMWVLSIITKS